MGEPARSYDAGEAGDVVELVDYLAEAIDDIDTVMTEWAVKRQELALKLAAVRASSSPAVQAAADDFAERVAEDRPYEDARDANAVLTEAFRRHGR